MSGAAGNDLDCAALVKVAEALDDVAAERLKLPQSVVVEFFPEVCNLNEVRIALQAELFRIFARGFYLARRGFIALSLEIGDDEIRRFEQAVSEVLEQADARQNRGSSRLR